MGLLLDRLDGSTRELTPLLSGVRAGASLWPVVSADGCTVTIISEMAFDLFRDDDEGSRWDVYRTVLPQCGGGGDWELVSATNGSGFAASMDASEPCESPDRSSSLAHAESNTAARAGDNRRPQRIAGRRVRTSKRRSGLRICRS